MGLRSLIKRVADKFSGEYSAAQADIRPDAPPVDVGGAAAPVTRARLKRPMDAKEEAASSAPAPTPPKES